MNRFTSTLRRLLAGQPAREPWDEAGRPRAWLFLLLLILAGTGLYGATIGGWRAPLQAVYTALKFPLLVVLTLADNGPGFEAHLLERLFEPYVTTKAKGTGLGLAIVKKIIEEHGGMIMVENIGEGALIRVRLPVWQAAQAVQGRGQQADT